MDEIGKAIKTALAERKLSVPKFGNSINLPAKTIQNIIYGNSRKSEHLEKIFIALGIDELGIGSNPVNNTLNPETDLDTYHRAFNTVLNTAKSKNAAFTKLQLDYMVMVMYDFLLANNNISGKSAEYFCLGMVEYATRNPSRTIKKLSKLSSE